MRSRSITLPTVSSAILTLLVVAGPATAQDVEIEFRYQPDVVGQSPTRQVLAIDDDEAEVTENGETREIKITKGEIRDLTDLIKKRVASFKFEKGERVQRPRMEIIFEFEGRNRIGLRARTGRGATESRLVPFGSDAWLSNYGNLIPDLVSKILKYKRRTG